MKSLRWVICAWVMALLCGCAASVRKDASITQVDARMAQASFHGVEVVLSEKARRLQADNPQFNASELARFLRTQFEGGGMLTPDGKHLLRVVVESFRVRSTFAAIMFGFMAGDDSLEGQVQAVDQRGAVLHQFHVTASYALGGLGGGQDGSRLNWLYEKFGELSLTEIKEAATLAGGTTAAPVAPNSATPANSVAPVLAAPASPSSAIANRPSTRLGGKVEDATALPHVGDRAKQAYRDWLGKPKPRAFALSEQGHWAATWGSNPADTAQPADPAERAIFACQQKRQDVKCRLYAVDDAVVW